MTLDRICNPTLAFSPNLPQWAVALLVVGFLFISIVMILIVLIQRPQGGGLSGAFGAGGGGSAGQTAFGARTGDALTISTITIFVLYLLVAIFLNYAIAPPTAETPTLAADVQQSAPASEKDDSTTFTDVPPAPDAPDAPVDDHAGHDHGPIDHTGHDHAVDDDTSGG